MVRAEEAAALLRPWLGVALLSRCDVCGQLCTLLNGFDGARGSIEALYRQVNALLFRTVHGMTRGDMRVLLDDGRVIRVRVDDIDQLADEALYLRFRQLTPSAAQCMRLREYAMSHDSLSALRALYVDFADFQSSEERAAIARTVRACHAPFRWQGWLKE